MAMATATDKIQEILLSVSKFYETEILKLNHMVSVNSDAIKQHHIYRQQQQQLQIAKDKEIKTLEERLKKQIICTEKWRKKYNEKDIDYGRSQENLKLVQDDNDNTDKLLRFYIRFVSDFCSV